MAKLSKRAEGRIITGLKRFQPILSSAKARDINESDKEPNLSGKVTVRPDGRISFPLIQDMQGSGLNPGKLKEQIEENLKQYIDAPNVTVIVEAIQSYRVFVIGKVNKSGAIILCGSFLC